MRLRLIINEIAKMKRRHIGLVASILILSVAGMSLMGAASGGADILTWQALLAGTSLAFPMTCPLLIAVIASRIVDMEHEGNGWLAGLSGGIGTGQVCRAKMVACWPCCNFDNHCSFRPASNSGHSLGRRLPAG